MTAITNAPDLANASGQGPVVHRHTADMAAVDSFKAAEAAFAAEETPAVEEKTKEEAPATETKTAEEADTKTEAEAKTAAEAEEKAAADAKTATDGKLSKGQQKKADRAAAAARRESEGALALANAENARLAAELAAAKGEKPAKAVTKVAADPDRPNPEDFEFGTLDPGYEEAKEIWLTKKIKRDLASERQSEAAEAKASETNAAFEKQVDALLEDHPDYYEVVEDGAAAKTWALSEHLGPLLKESAVGAKIAYHLASNPAESIRIYKLSPAQQGLEFAKLEAKFSAAEPPVTGETGKKPVVSKAEPPLTENRGAGGKFKVAPSSTDFKAVEAAYGHLTLNNP